MKKLFVFALLIGSSNFAKAALPPYWDSLNRLAAATHSDEVNKALNGAAVVRVRENDDGTYTVSSKTCGTTVRVSAVPSTMPGATEYKFESVVQTICQ